MTWLWELETWIGSECWSSERKHYPMKANLGLSVAVQDNAQVWMPSPPPVDKPRANYNAASLAYLGDAIYEVYCLILLCFLFVCFFNLWFMSLRYLVHGLSWVWNHGDMQDIPLNVTSWILGQVYVRRHFLMPPQTIDSYNKRVMAVVCCEAQVGNIHFPNEVGCLGVLSWSRCARVQVDVVPHCTWPVETSWQDHVVLFSHSLWYYIVKMAGCNAQGLTEGHFSNRRRKVSSCIHWVSTSLSYLLSFLFSFK